MFEHEDTLSALNKHLSLKEKIICAHQTAKDKFPFIARIAVTIYDPETKVLKSYLHSGEDKDPFEHYQALLKDAPTLKKILKKGRPRVINNMLTFENNKHEHQRRIGRQGYNASYTMPIFHSGEFFGFLFFNSYEKDVFSEKILSDLDVYGHLISLMVINELTTLKIISAVIKTTAHITHQRDPETGSHLDRISRYCRLIATSLSIKYKLNDNYIEHVFMFAPLHDIGKIAIPDNILLKPDGLSADEQDVMRTHARKGREMIDDIIGNFGLDNMDSINILRNIAEYHHEAVNGTGYPEGRVSESIPLEARIVAVADVFDALTTKRPYKDAWTNESAFEKLQQLADEKLDRDCVNALIENQAEVEEIQKRFNENLYG